MKALVRFSLAQVVFYNLVFVFLIVAGAFALLSSPVEQYPNVNFGEVLVHTYFPGASPQDVESLVTKKIEDALEDVADVEFIESTSYRARSTIHLKFIDDSDYERLYGELRFKILGMLNELPDSVDPPSIELIEINDVVPMVVVNLKGERSNRALSLMAKEMKLKLEKISGIKQIKITGEYIREFHIFLDREKLTALGLTFDGVAAALERANLSIPAGNFSNSAGEFVVRVDEQFRSPEQVLNTVLRRDGDGGFIRLADVASQVKAGYRDPLVISSVNGEAAVALQVIKANAGNALTIIKQLKAITEEFQPMLAKEGVSTVLTQDSTLRVKDDIETLGYNMLLGIILVALLIGYFMGLRNAGLTVVGIPFAFLVTLLIMYLTGNSLNQITLFAFVLVSGIVVDDAIVVLENIYRHVETGQELKQAIIDGTSEVMLPVLAATSTTVAAFLPLLIMTGTTGEFFAQIPMAVSFAIVASLFECLLILPIHYFDYGPKPKLSSENVTQDTKALSQKQDIAAEIAAEVADDNLFMRVARRITETMIQLTLRFRFTSLFVVFIAFIAAVSIMGLSLSGTVPLIRIQFFPDDYSLYYIDYEAPSSASIEQVAKEMEAMSRFVMQDGAGMAESAAGFAGFKLNEDYQELFDSNIGMVMVTLPPRNQQHFADYPSNDPLKHLEWMQQRIKEKFDKPGYHIELRPQKDGPPTGKALNVRVLGNDNQAITGLADNLLQFLQEDPEIAPHLVNLEDSRGRPKRVLRFHVNQQGSYEYNLSPAQVAQLSASALDGRYIGKYRFDDEEVDMKLRINPAQLQQPGDALRIPLIEHAGGAVRLEDVASLASVQEPGYLKRYQGQRVISLSANLKANVPTSTPVIVKRIEQYYANIREQYPGATLLFGGAHEDTKRSYTSLAYAFILAILIMYVILATQFQSYLQPLIILSAIVFALIGVVFGKLLTQSLFTVNSFIAIIGVTGVVVNDSLVLVDFINKRYRAGASRRAAIEAGIRIRLRPILLTTLTTTLGLLPMAFGIPYYSLVWGTMASTFVNGLATATMLTLFIVPVLWNLLEGAKLRFSRKQQINGSE
ncbi:efflux RND transporter permease subunit [Candidatus Venteria ishoeyi]|uniref:Multidrug resistance protein MdtC n=1 Tax=Candidatus Venteria ishoeyi TaxID=1899563 RepID=A0A1H6F9H8_9GAMM|nr:efflux RND transporter permease subunit [Candidatus Venteria ishoeyi]SEH06752.1 Multidrug resistance protein MdtC [Candidatus Venteria ishoeyi]